MEHCRHKDLTEFFFTRELPEQEKIDVMIQMAEGLSYLHKNNIIPRDIKQRNILISNDDPIVANFLKKTVIPPS